MYPKLTTMYIPMRNMAQRSTSRWSQNDMLSPASSSGAPASLLVICFFSSIILIEKGVAQPFRKTCNPLCR